MFFQITVRLKVEMLLKFSLFLSDYLLFQGVVNVIPHTWKLPLSNGDYGNHIGRVEKVENIASMTSKSIYSNLVKRIQIPSNSQYKLNSLCNISTILERKNIYRLPSPECGLFSIKFETILCI